MLRSGGGRETQELYICLRFRFAGILEAKARTAPNKVSKSNVTEKSNFTKEEEKWQEKIRFWCRSRCFGRENSSSMRRGGRGEFTRKFWKHMFKFDIIKIIMKFSCTGQTERISWYLKSHVRRLTAVDKQGVLILCTNICPCFCLTFCRSIFVRRRRSNFIDWKQQKDG